MDDKLYFLFVRMLKDLVVRENIFGYVHCLNELASSRLESVKWKRLRGSTYSLIYYGYLDTLLSDDYYRLDMENDCSCKFAELAATRGHFHIINSESNGGLLKHFSGFELSIAAERQYLNIIEYLLNNLDKCQQDLGSALVGVVESGNIDLLKLLLSRYIEKEGGGQHYMVEDEYIQRAIARASKNGEKDMVTYLFDYVSPFSIGNSYFFSAMELAAMHGYIELVEILHENKVLSSKKAIEYAATFGHIKVVTFLHLNRSDGCSKRAAVGAAGNGHTEVVKFLLDNRTEASPQSVLESAISTGHSEVIDCLFENQFIKQDTTIATQVFSQALFAGHGNLEMFKSIKRHLPETIFSPLLMDYALSISRSLELAKWLYQQYKLTFSDYILPPKLLLNSIDSRSLETVKWVVETVESYPRDCTIINAAIEHDCFDIVRYLIDSNLFYCENKTIEVAARMGSVDVLDYIKDNYFDYKQLVSTTRAMDLAACNGHLEAVKWLHQHRTEGCTEDAMDMAAVMGHLEIVKFLHKNRTEGCTTDAIDNSLTNRDRADIVRYLLFNRTEGYTDRSIERIVEFDNIGVDLTPLLRKEKKSVFNSNSNNDQCILM